MHSQVVFQPNKDEKAQLQDAVRAQMEAAAAAATSAGEPEQETRQEQVAKKPYQFLLVSRLREYLALEFRSITAPFPVDVERVYDDFGALRLHLVVVVTVTLVLSRGCRKGLLPALISANVA
jgi:hypothetical protein